MGKDLERFVDLIRTWQHERVAVFRREGYNNGTNANSLRRFVEAENSLARQVIRLFETSDPEFFSAMTEIGMNCQGIVEGRKVFVDKQDRTSEGM